MTAVDPVVPVPAKPSLWPTRKWFATQVTALTGLAVMYVTTGGWNAEETIAAITIASQAALGYIYPNQDTPGGVPVETGPKP